MGMILPAASVYGPAEELADEATESPFSFSTFLVPSVASSRSLACSCRRFRRTIKTAPMMRARPAIAPMTMPAIAPPDKLLELCLVSFMLLDELAVALVVKPVPLLLIVTVASAALPADVVR